MNKIEKFRDLFQDDSKNLIVPAYQRAYSWTDKQLAEFVSDLKEILGKEYYYGHFILEETENSYDIIDGQQRLTTFILFLMVCRKLKQTHDFDNYIKKFKTVDYDSENFEILKKVSFQGDWELPSSSQDNNQTLSIKRILSALNYFEKLFKKTKEDKLSLNIDEIDNYIQTLLDAHISAHITHSKAVAVQIFELQNTRGIQLSLIEKVKAKLMKTVYMFDNAVDNITKIQSCFARIYELEESVKSNSFRGEFSLDYILLHHLRMIDDGEKINSDSQKTNIFQSPLKNGNQEDLVLVYLDKKIQENSNQNVVKYVCNLSENFMKTIEFISLKLPLLDNENHLVGDVIILDKSLSLEFLLLLHFKEMDDKITSKEFMILWEKFLFTQDFHDRYYRKTYRANFEGLFYNVLKSDTPEIILNKYVSEGFRSELMDGGDLPATVKKYIEDKRLSFSTNAYSFLTEKVVYALYKYEILIGANLLKLREIMRSGRSIEHILPVGFGRNWYTERTNQNDDEFEKETRRIINGLGNLLLVTPQENSSVSNKHPKEKKYNSCSGGSYDLHNSGKERWENPSEWKSIIETRGEEIFSFLVNNLIKVDGLD